MQKERKYQYALNGKTLEENYADYINNRNKKRQKQLLEKYYSRSKKQQEYIEKVIEETVEESIEKIIDGKADKILKKMKFEI